MQSLLSCLVFLCLALLYFVLFCMRWKGGKGTSKFKGVSESPPLSCKNGDKRRSFPPSFLPFLSNHHLRPSTFDPATASPLHYYHFQLASCTNTAYYCNRSFNELIIKMSNAGNPVTSWIRGGMEVYSVRASRMQDRVAE